MEPEQMNQQPAAQPASPMGADAGQVPHMTWYIVGAIAILAALGYWYYSAQTPAADTENVGTEESAAAIADEFNQIPDDTAALDAEASASAAAVSGF